jgi:hypothetical protein
MPASQMTHRLVAATALTAALATAGCGSGPRSAHYPFRDVDHRAQVARALRGCADRLETWRASGAQTVLADVDADGARDAVVVAVRFHELQWHGADLRADGRVHEGPQGLDAGERAALPNRRSGGWVGLVVTSGADRRVRAVELPDPGGDPGAVAHDTHLQLAAGRLYVASSEAVRRLDAGALHSGRVGRPVADVSDWGQHGWSVSELGVLADCEGPGRDTVMVRATHLGPVRSCLATAPGRDVHEARQSGLFAISAGHRRLVKVERIDDELLGCNS